MSGWIPSQVGSAGAGPSPMDPAVQQQMIQGLLSQGKSPEEAQAMVAQMLQAVALKSGANAPPPAQPAEVAPGPIPGAPPQISSGPSAPAPVGASPPPTPGLAEPMGPSSPFSNPELVGSVLGMGERQGQMARAQAMRDADVPRGHSVSNGRVYVASSPLEHLAVGYGKYKGTKDLKRLEKEQTAAKKEIIDALRNQQMGPMAPSATSATQMLPDGGMLA